MTRPLTRPRAWSDTIRNPRVFGGIDVFDPADAWCDTGLLDAAGNPLCRYVGPEPIGFLHDVPRAEPVSHAIAELPDDATEVPPLTRG